MSISTNIVAGIVMGFVLGFLFGRLMSRREGTKSENAKGGRTATQKSRKSVEIYVGNLPYEVDEKELANLFQRFGNVISTRIIQHRGEGRSKGYGFVEMADSRAAQAAIRGMNGQELKGRKLVVNEARSRGKNGESDED
ncbi:MAG: RNA recognition motif domain-containing protein [Kiritimatiellia bacterium]